MLAEEHGGFWHFVLLVVGILALGLGALLAVWAGNDKSARWFNQYVRATEVARRIIGRIVSLALSIVVAFWAFANAQGATSVASFVVILAVQLIAVALAVSALSASPPIIGVLTRARPGRARTWSLLVWLIACVVAGAVSTVAASQLQSQVATIGVVIAVAAVFLTTYGQQHKTFDVRLDLLQESLSALHRQLITDDSESQLLKAATDLEAALTPYPPAPFALPVPAPLDSALRASLFYALTRVTSLPFREVLTGDASRLDGVLASRNLREELLDFVWELRRRVLYSASVVIQQGTSRYSPPPAQVLLGIDATEEILTPESELEATTYLPAPRSLEARQKWPPHDALMLTFSDH
ncbi:hypothetical protein [Cryobacterium sp. Y57]|uniref:hypothetical protein n=1 Tax=Cryobacterium sp. Y57 TaxID=2048287 RepID=UPI0013049384|nr:hypothetical protein [Cryobacterium sp. Y57]